MRLGTACVNFYGTIRANRITNGTCVSMAQFLNSFKKGSSPLRRILYNSKTKNIPITNRRHVISFLRITELAEPDCTVLSRTNESWNICQYPNKVREFILKFNSNILGINTRVSNFANEISRECTFCATAKNLPAMEESFLHLFFYCVSTSHWLHQFEILYYPEIVFNSEVERKKFWFLHLIPGGGGCEKFFRVVFNMVF